MSASDFFKISNSIFDTIASVFSSGPNTSSGPTNIPNNLTNINVASDDEELREVKKKEPETPEYALNEYYKLKNKYEVE